MYSKRIKHRSFSGPYFQQTMYLQKKGKNDCDRLTELLESGVNPNASDDNGRTALHLASASGYSNIVKILLSFNADCNVVDKLGNTPLHLAVCTTSTTSINLLLNAGCSAFQKGHSGCTPLQLAQTKLWLLQRYCNPDYTEIRSKISEIIDIMKMMVKDQDQEKKLTEMFASGLLLNDNANLATDVNRILQTLNDLRL
ncbi:hypothetical protein RUM43_014685 [Polyplax serrata]|uniref:Uncharacterized protein n=1 Tax=Polyplax serrata TaxID=468196 RepID=A0AAN8NYV4_POLSC